jgi:hypothetical protein
MPLALNYNNPVTKRKIFMTSRAQAAGFPLAVKMNRFTSIRISLLGEGPARTIRR